MSEPSPVPPDLRDRVAVVTGAAHGIGRAIANALTMAGAKVLAVDKDREGLRSADPGWIAVDADMARMDTDVLANELLAAHGPIELIVNNVGITTPHSFLRLDAENFDLVMRTNLRGPWFFTKRLVQALIDARRLGSIVFISSLHDTYLRLNPHYSASKAAVAMLTKELAHELGPHGIRVNAISPGWIETEANPVGEAGRLHTHALIPLGRVGTPEDVARVAIAVLSDAWAGYVTGVNVAVDGGLSLHDWLMDMQRGGGTE